MEKNFLDFGHPFLPKNLAYCFTSFFFYTMETNRYPLPRLQHPNVNDFKHTNYLPVFTEFITVYECHLLPVNKPKTFHLSSLCVFEDHMKENFVKNSPNQPKRMLRKYLRDELMFVDQDTNYSCLPFSRLFRDWKLLHKFQSELLSLALH